MLFFFWTGGMGGAVPHKPAITRLTAHFICGLMSDLMICKDSKEYDHT